MVNTRSARSPRRRHEFAGVLDRFDVEQDGLRAPVHREIIEQVERIARRVKLDVGGIEYMIDQRDGRHYFYDINALSNFVADARNVIGFDPFERLVDYLIERSGIAVTTTDEAGVTV